MSRYEGPILDAHHHFWEPGMGTIPWLRPETMIPFRYGDYSDIKRDYLPPDLQRDAAGLNVVGTVTMETEWDQRDPIGEMQYTADIAARWGWPNAAVAHACLDWPNADDTLAKLASQPLVRGVRHKPGQAHSPSVPVPTTLMSDIQWRKGYASLAKHGLHFELQTAWWHLQEALMLARDYPETTIVINHAGLPSNRSREGIRGWRQALMSIASASNVAIKISGIGQPGRQWSVDDNREIVDTVAECFGSNRIMFASNFPVDSLVGTYSEIYEGFLNLTANWSHQDQQAAFIGNAIRYYRLPETLLEARPATYLHQG